MEHINVTVWNEGIHEKLHEEVKKIYPNGIHSVLFNFLTDQGFNVRTATLDEPENGLPESVLENHRCSHLVGTHGSRSSE